MHTYNDLSIAPGCGTQKEGTPERVNILFLINDLGVNGTSKTLYYLISGLDRAIYNPIVCTLRDAGGYKETITACGVKYYTLGLRDYLSAPAALYKLVRILKKENISLLHSHLFYSDIMARAAGFFAGTPVVITSMRNMDVWRQYYHVFIDSLTYNLSSAIISNSIAGAEKLSGAERTPSEKIKVVYSAIKFDDYKRPDSYNAANFRKSIKVSENDVIVTTIARLDEEKDHFTLIKAARRLLDEYEREKKGVNVKFLIVGEGELEDEIRDKISECGLAGNFIMLGQRRDIKNILYASDVFLLTSMYEGLPHAILEAQACGVPVVATDAGGVSEIIESNYNGLLCKPGDCADIAQKLDFVISNEPVRQKFIINAREKLKAKFSFENMIAKTGAIYKNLLVQNASELAQKFFSSEEFKIKLNILYLITSSDVGGAQKHLLSLVKYFMGKSHQIKVATSPGEPMNSSLKRLGIMPVQLKYLQKSINPLYDALTFYDISKLLIENNFHIIHCHSTKAGILGRLAAYFAGTPVKVFTAHGFVFHENMNFIKRYLCVIAEKLGGLFTDGLITVSWADFRKALMYKIAPPEKLKVIHNGINYSEIDEFTAGNKDVSHTFRRKYGVPDDAVVIGSVGRLVYEKSYSTAIKAFSRLLPSCPGAVLLIAGEGYERMTLESLARSFNISEKVIFTGEVAAIYEIYSIIDIFFLSSVKEGLPYSLLEAGAFGKLCVCSDAGGISDVIADGKTGILAAPGADGLYNALTKALALSPEAVNEMRVNLRRKVSEEFSEEKMLSGVEKFYAKLFVKKGLITGV